MNVEGEPIDRGIAVLRRIVELHDKGNHRIEGIAITVEHELDEKGKLNITTLRISARPVPRPS